MGGGGGEGQRSTNVVMHRHAMTMKNDPNRTTICLVSNQRKYNLTGGGGGEGGGRQRPGTIHHDH